MSVSYTHGSGVCTFIMHSVRVNRVRENSTTHMRVCNFFELKEKLPSKENKAPKLFSLEGQSAFIQHEEQCTYALCTPILSLYEEELQAKVNI